jgi:hypothetical protein
MIRNIHERRFPCETSTVGAVLDTLASDNDLVWPADSWPPMRLSDGLSVGSSGGHGPIRYDVEHYEPGVSVVFRFDPTIGLIGDHRLDVTANGDGTTTLRHQLQGRPVGAMRLAWPLLFRWMHDALIEDAFDNVSAAVDGRPAPTTRHHSLLVRQLRKAQRPRVRRATSMSGRVAGNSTAVALAAVGALHAAWGLGLTWPGSDAASLARRVVGGEAMPSSTACFGVAGLSMAAAGLVTARTRPRSVFGRSLPAPLVELGVVTAGGVLALRGIVGPVVSSLKLVRTTAEFRRLDVLLFSPVCIALAAGAWSTLRTAP